MEKIIDKFIKKYLEDLRYYALYDNSGNFNEIFIFNKNGRNVVYIHIFKFATIPIKIGLDITINKDLYDEVSSVIGVTSVRDIRAYEKNKTYFKTQFLNQILDKVMGYVSEHFPNRRIEDPDVYFSKLNRKESDVSSGDNGIPYDVKRF